MASKLRLVHEYSMSPNVKKCYIKMIYLRSLCCIERDQSNCSEWIKVPLMNNYGELCWTWHKILSSSRISIATSLLVTDYQKNKEKETSNVHYKSLRLVSFPQAISCFNLWVNVTLGLLYFCAYLSPQMITPESDCSCLKETPILTTSMPIILMWVFTNTHMQVHTFTHIFSLVLVMN